MKNLILTAILMVAVSSLGFTQAKPAKDAKEMKDTKVKAPVTDYEKGQALFNKNNCQACHGQVVIGPPMKDVIGKYKDADSFMKMLANPPKSGKFPVPMPPAKVTKDEAKLILAFIKEDVKKTSAKPAQKPIESEKPKKDSKKN